MTEFSKANKRAVRRAQVVDGHGPSASSRNSRSSRARRSNSSHARAASAASAGGGCRKHLEPVRQPVAQRRRKHLGLFLVADPRGEPYARLLDLVHRELADLIRVRRSRPTGSPELLRRGFRALPRTFPPLDNIFSIRGCGRGPSCSDDGHGGARSSARRSDPGARGQGDSAGLEGAGGRTAAACRQRERIASGTTRSISRPLTTASSPAWLSPLELAQQDPPTR